MKKHTFLMVAFLCLIFGIVVTAHAATYTYDDLNRLTSVDYENGQTITYTYDAGGNLLSVTIAAAPVTIYGDVNGDSRINSGDATLVLRSYARLTTLTSSQLIAADVNGDGKVNSADATLILRYYARLITKFPVQP